MGLSNGESDATGTVGGVVMRNRVFDLDKNRIKCNRNRIWSRPSSFLSFFKQSLSSATNGSGGGGEAGASSNYNENVTRPAGSSVPPSNSSIPQTPSEESPVDSVDSKAPATGGQRLDLNMIRKLEEEIYKRGREQRPDAEAKDFHEFYFNSRRHSGGERKTFTSDTSAFNGDNHRAVLLVDPNALEPILLKRPLSTDETRLVMMMSDGAGATTGDKPAQDPGPALHHPAASGGGGNKSIIIVDNSEYYPVLMRYDINADEIDRQQQQQQQYRRNRAEMLKIDTTTGACSTSSAPTGRPVAPINLRRPPSGPDSVTTTSPSAVGFPMKSDEKLSSFASSSLSSSLSGATSSSVEHPSPQSSLELHGLAAPKHRLRD